MALDAGSNHGRHDLWLEMQAAYQRYLDASVAFDDVIEAEDIQNSSLRLQRMAFEEYVEARLQFSESLLPPCGADTVTRQPSEVASRSWIGFLKSKWVVPGFAVAALCLMAVSLPFFMRDQGQFRNLSDGSRNQTNCDFPKPHVSKAEEMATQSDVNLPTVALRSDLPTVIQGSQPPPAQVRHESQSKASIQPERTRKRNTPSVRPQHAAKRKRYEFTLRVSSRVISIGPFQTSLNRIGWKHDDFDVSLWYGDFRIDKKHARLDEPLWIRLGGRSRPFQLRIDRIGTGYVHGYLCDYRCEKQVPASPSQRTPNLALSNRGGALFENP